VLDASRHPSRAEVGAFTELNDEGAGVLQSVHRRPRIALRRRTVITSRSCCSHVSVMETSKQVTFGRFRLDPANERLWRGEQAVALRPKAFAVLKHLVEHRGQLVTKQQLLDTVWPATFVTDAVLKDSVRQLREALEDDAATPRYIETAHRRGYRFIGQPSETAARCQRRRMPGDGGLSPVSILGRERAQDGELARSRRAPGRVRDRRPGIGKTTLVKRCWNTRPPCRASSSPGQCLEQQRRRVVCRCSMACRGSREYPSARASSNCCGSTRRPGFSSCRRCWP
jgi:DNA-binding winged helix-turn-helix (wHTH) protein